MNLNFNITSSLKILMIIEIINYNIRNVSCLTKVLFNFHLWDAHACRRVVPKCLIRLFHLLKHFVHRNKACTRKYYDINILSCFMYSYAIYFIKLS